MDKIKEYWAKTKAFLVKPLIFGLVMWQVGLIGVVLAFVGWYFLFNNKRGF